ncbi:MAG: Gfo/Idh/MocA family oxidoreductase [bacterium]|nr:Gfo/Idh/MocA family oxidoreductase [bacterium]
MTTRRLSRRTFLAGVASVTAGCATRPGKAPAVISTRSPNDKLNVAAIGCGGKGFVDISGAAAVGENVVALCDVDLNRAKRAFHTWPDAKQYQDYRVMLEKQKDIDAVTISTPDHTHACATMLAMSLGKHVYTQKPLTHSIFEARALTKAAAKYDVATQMGNQGHSMEDTRVACELVWAGAIGDVREVHCWTDRPEGGRWKQGITTISPALPVPDYLDWDVWIGPAPMRAYNYDYHPRNWRGWWDFGCGALGDMGCHIMDAPYWALHLGAPTSVECTHQKNNNDQTGPTECVIRYEFPERVIDGKTLPPVTLYWYEGSVMPPKPEAMGDTPLDTNGTLMIGSDGVLNSGATGDKPRLFPESLDKDFVRPDPTIERVGGPYEDWIAACKGVRPQACSNFSYSGPLTEAVLLGNVALRVGERCEWNAKKMKITNLPEANRFVGRDYREGWTL